MPILTFKSLFPLVQNTNDRKSMRPYDIYSKVNYFHSLFERDRAQFQQGNVYCQVLVVSSKEHSKGTQNKSVFPTILILQENLSVLQISCSQEYCSVCNLSLT